ncbi:MULTISPECIES: YgiQ family radical SAM protein [unclassified Haematospirillum]|uniref:YgiQ family radical SAM protein n=1 Tax=unclassified Haematospirillum TaxID=2622088 RepID=UPI00143C376E|nr:MULTISPECIES: YgiQ family radical SAM protein [unclassified Haematospirillum]NKD54445.1 YgiQ family radical SAM protein [Haematospirillum sp. H4890]NKD74488.1 YgiQ family radical SAM protein [Haematospirillum sp. H4485]
MDSAKAITSYRKHWASRFGTAPFLPTSRAEMDALGWDSCDIILVTGDAYVDHPSFGMAVIGRTWEDQGFRVGIIAQPDWTNPDAFRALGRPNLFFGVTAGNMDSMVNHYTSDRRIRHNDSYTPNDEGGKRPDRAVIVYSQRCREAWRDVPIVIGGIEASLRRIAHYDYWSDKVRRSVLMDSKADILCYGNAERAIVEIAHRAARGQHPRTMTDIRGVAVMRDSVPEGWVVLDASTIDCASRHVGEGAEVAGGESALRRVNTADHPAERTVVRLPSFESVADDKVLYGHASRILHLESNPGNARALVQRHGDKEVWLTPPPIPLTTAEMDHVFGLPYARAPHPSYGDARIPAWEMIRFSVNIMRGCFGGCSFCSITEHEGRIIQSRSEASVLKEIELIRDKTKGFTGVISDLGGPTANMYRLACKDQAIQDVCRRPSCVYPSICSNLNTDHSSLVQLYRKARDIDGIKKILIASGLRYDLAVRSPEYVRELTTHHVGGYLKIAPEHTEEGPLSKMMKPGIGTYEAFRTLFEKYSRETGKEQYLIPYFIAAHPGTTDEDMMNLALWLKRNGFRADQVQAFLPSPMSLAAAMYRSERNPLKPVKRDEGDIVYTPRGLRQRRLHKAFLRYHDPENWPMLREALQRMGRADLIGNGKKHLVPSWQPAGTGRQGGEGKRTGRKHGTQSFFTTHAGQGRRPANASKTGRVRARHVPSP